MAVTTSRVHAVLTTLQSRLTARAGMANVPVYSAHPGKFAPDTDCLFFIDAEEADETFEAINPTTTPKWETVRITGQIYSKAAMVGATTVESATQTCRARAQAIKAELEDDIRGQTNLNAYATATGINWIRMAAWKLEQGDDPSNDRICKIDFTLEYKARL